MKRKVFRMLIQVTRLEYFTKLQYMVHKEEDKDYIKWFDSANNLVGMMKYDKNENTFFLTEEYSKL